MLARSRRSGWVAVVPIAADGGCDVRDRLVKRAGTLLLAALAATVVAAAVPAPPALAAACPKTTLAAVENEVMCPVCGVPLALATEAPQAQRQRAFIEREVERCRSKEQIKAALVAQFGERILALPPERGFNLVAYLVPGLIVVAGGLVVATIARRRRRSALAPSEPALAGDDAARLDADLRRYRL